MLTILLTIFNSCAPSKKMQTITTSQLYEIHDMHTTSHTVYYGSDSLYHYFGKTILFKRDKKYKLKRDELTMQGEFAITEKRKPVLFSKPFMGVSRVINYEK